MKNICKAILLAGLCWSVVVHAKDTREQSDTIKHQLVTESAIKLGEVVVTGLTGSQKLRQSPAPVSIISPRQLEMQSPINIVDAISRQPGVAQITTGSGIAKPVIRGLGYNRVVIVNDGIRQEGQQWGDEHGLEIDPFGVHSVEILKGPASLMYGSDAMAGVVVFHSAPTLMQGEMRANVSTGYQCNNGLFNYSLNFAGHKGGLVWNARYSGQAAHAYKNAADGYVYGSALRSQAYSQLLGWNYRKGHTHIIFDYYHQTPGIIEGERNPQTGQLVTPEGYSAKSYGTPMPYQQIHHYKAVVDNSWFVGDGNIKLLVGYQHNRRQEFEEEDNPNQCGLDFMLHTVNYDLHYLSPVISGWKIAAGMAGMWQRSVNKGTEFLIPSYRLLDYGMFATASREMGKANVSGGIRYDHRRLHSDALYDGADAEGSDVLRFSKFSRSFEGVTGSMGVTWQAAPNVNLKLNLARGFRTPNISELASNGVHEGTQRYEVGNNALKPENSWQADFGITYSSLLVSAELALFANHINHYIYSERLADDSGNSIVVEGIPSYRFTSGDARIWGGEARIDIHPTTHLHIGNTFSYVNSVQLNRSADARWLPFTPAPRWIADVRYEFVCESPHVAHLFVRVEADCNLRQNHCLLANGTETPTPSYTLLNAYAGVDVKNHGRRLLSLYLSAQNITDRIYQSHLSRLKYTGVKAITGRRGVYNMGRNVCLKVVVPIEL